MKRARPIAVVTLSSLLILGLGRVGLSQQRPAEQRVLIGFKEGIGRQAAGKRRAWVRNLGGEVQHSFRFLPLVSARLPQSLISKLKDLTEIAYVEDDIIVHAVAQEIPWGVDHIDAELVWSTSTGKGVTVAILDTGIDYDHPDLIDNIAGGINFAGWWWSDGSTNKFLWNDKYGHGSHCAGIVAASNNDIGVVGVAPGARLQAVKVLGDDGTGYVSDIIQGLEWCVENVIDIVSMSFGSVEYSESLDNACQAAYGAGVLLVAAAGNENGGALHYPGACESVIAVSATNANDEVADFSSIGPEVELAAPGVDIKSTYRYGAYGIGSGTSMACPHVAGTAALVFAANPTLSHQQVRLRLRTTADDLGAPGPDNLYGYGLVNAAAAAQTADVHDVAVAHIDAASSTAGPVTGETDTADNSKSTTVTLEASVFDIAITAVTAPSTVLQGDAASVDVAVENAGNQDVASDITVILTDDTDGVAIGGQIISGGLTADASITLTYSWQTDDLTSVGDHILTASHDLTDDDTSNDSRSTTVTVQGEPAAPIAYVNIDMAKQSFWTWWRVTATVTIVDEQATPIGGATVRGHWSGVYERNVSGIATNGQVTLWTGWMQTSGTLTLTIDSIVKNNLEYVLYGETGESISH